MPRDVRAFAAIGAWSGLIGVVAGAFGAHALRARLAPELLSAFETGARYQLVHALALIVVAWSAESSRAGAGRVAGWLFVAGTVIFSGSLYALALLPSRAFGLLTPVGGLCLIGGWASLALAFGSRRP